MALEKTVSVRLTADGYEDARLKIDRLTVASEELARQHPEISPKIDSAKALLEARLLRDGIKKELSGAVTDVSGGSGGGGILSSLFSQVGGGSGGLGFLPESLSSPVGLAAVAAGIGALLPELTGVVAGLSAATAGVGAFGLLALPTFDKIKTAYTAISTAQTAYNAAAALNKEDPTKTHATDAATALDKLKIAQQSMGPSTRTAVTGINDLMTSFGNMAKAFQPTVMKVFNDGLKDANDLLPALKPFADAAGGAIDGLLKQVGKFSQSSGFKDWVKQFSSLAGPSITAIGDGIGKVAVSIGKLLTSMSGKDVAHSLNIAFDAIAGTINAFTWTVKQLMVSWDGLSSRMVKFASVVGPPILRFAAVAVGSFKIVADVALAAFGAIIGSAVKAFGWVPGIGPKLKTAATAFDDFRKSVDDNLNTASKNLNQWAQDVQNAPKIVKIKGDISDLTAKLNTAKAELKDKNLTAPQATQIQANISQLEAQIRKARAELAALNGTTATTYVDTVALTAPPGKLKKLAAGGPVSGPAWVGENGPEMVTFPPGSYVHSNAQSRAMMSGTGNTYNITVNLPHGSDREQGRRIVASIREFEKVSGHGWRK